MRSLAPRYKAFVRRCATALARALALGTAFRFAISTCAVATASARTPRTAAASPASAATRSAARCCNRAAIASKLAARAVAAATFASATPAAAAARAKPSLKLAITAYRQIVVGLAHLNNHRRGVGNCPRSSMANGRRPARPTVWFVPPSAGPQMISRACVFLWLRALCGRYWAKHNLNDAAPPTKLF
jgi:hypothetical protein